MRDRVSISLGCWQKLQMFSCALSKKKLKDSSVHILAMVVAVNDAVRWPSTSEMLLLWRAADRLSQWLRTNSLTLMLKYHLSSLTNHPGSNIWVNHLPRIPTALAAQNNYPPQSAGFSPALSNMLDKALWSWGCLATTLPWVYQRLHFACA